MDKDENGVDDMA